MERRLGAHRVVITGIGVVSSIGVDTEAFWKAALAGEVGTAEITLFDTSDYLTHRGGEVHGWAASEHVSGRLRSAGVASMSRSESFAVAAARMAVADAGFPQPQHQHRAVGSLAPYDPARVGVCTGIVIGNRPGTEATIRTLHAAGSDQTPVTAHDLTRVSRLPAIDLGLSGPNLVLPNACAAGNVALGAAADMITTGRADAMIAGGTDELSEAMFVMFDSLRAFAPDWVQPFDANRRGLMLSEGSAFLFLEAEERAVARGASSYGVLAGHANYADAFHMTAPHPEGTGALRAMRAALAMAGHGPHQVDYISAHGTGTPANDHVEAKAIADLLGEEAGNVAVSAIKSMLGHPQGAAAAIEAASCLLAIKHGVVPPTANLTTLDPRCRLDVVADRPRTARVDVALNNAFGFGGNSSCVVFTATESG